MKKFFQFIVEFKSWLSLCFTSAMFIFLTISWIVGGRSVEIAVLFQIFLLTVGATLLQFVFFSGWVIKKMRYSLRLILFVLPMLALVTVFAVWCDWVPVENPGAWIWFFVSFFVCFVLICAGFEFCFWVTGKKYDGLLGQYREKREKRP